MAALIADITGQNPLPKTALRSLSWRPRLSDRLWDIPAVLGSGGERPLLEQADVRELLRAVSLSEQGWPFADCEVESNLRVSCHLLKFASQRACDRPEPSLIIGFQTGAGSDVEVSR